MTIDIHKANNWKKILLQKRCYNHGVQIWKKQYLISI